MLNVIIQNIGAHSETIATFVEILSGQCCVFYPANSHVVSHESYITRHFGTEFIKCVADLLTTIDSTTDHGLLIFNTSVELHEPWAAPILARWTGAKVVYHHENRIFEEPGLVQFHAHPFYDIDSYLLPVSHIFAAESIAEPPPAFDATLIIPNWTRPSHIQNKHLSLLSHYMKTVDLTKFRFVLTGMKMDIMKQAVSDMPHADKIVIRHQLTVEALVRLLRQRRTYVMPLIDPNGRYAREGLTGSLPLAINCSCPVIISRQIAAAYELDYYFDENYIFEDLPEEDLLYDDHAKNIAAERSRIIAKNKQRFEHLVRGAR